MGKIVILLSMLFVLAGTACTFRANPGPGHLPPGQAKKMMGSQSAKPFAPGQHKH